MGLDENGEAPVRVDTANIEGIEGGLYGAPINYGLRRVSSVPKAKFAKKTKLAKETVWCKHFEFYQLK